MIGITQTVKNNGNLRKKRICLLQIVSLHVKLWFAKNLIQFEDKVSRVTEFSGMVNYRYYPMSVSI